MDMPASLLKTHWLFWRTFSPIKNRRKQNITILYPKSFFKHPRLTKLVLFIQCGFFWSHAVEISTGYDFGPRFGKRFTKPRPTELIMYTPLKWGWQKARRYTKNSKTERVAWVFCALLKTQRTFITFNKNNIISSIFNQKWAKPKSSWVKLMKTTYISNQLVTFFSTS